MKPPSISRTGSLNPPISDSGHLLRQSDSVHLSTVSPNSLFLSPAVRTTIFRRDSNVKQRNRPSSYVYSKLWQMNLNSSGKSNCLYSKLTKDSEQCRKLEIDLNLPASSSETESTHYVTNSDDDALSRYAGMEIRRSECEHQQPLNGRPHNDNSVSDSMDSSQKDARKKKSSGSNIVKWKQQVKVSLEIGLEVPPNDGYMWRKYGQKEILNAKYPREYYRCTYRNTHGCCATKQVQRSSEDPSIFDITYLGKHTCPKISKTNDLYSATESGYGLINFSSIPESTSHSSRTSDISSAISRNSFELSNWPQNHN